MLQSPCRLLCCLSLLGLPHQLFMKLSNVRNNFITHRQLQCKHISDSQAFRSPQRSDNFCSIILNTMSAVVWRAGYGHVTKNSRTFKDRQKPRHYTRCNTLHKKLQTTPCTTSCRDTRTVRENLIKTVDRIL